MIRIFKVGTKFDKDPGFYLNPSLHGSVFNISDTKAATARRAMLVPFFSREPVRRAEPTLLRSTIDKFLTLLQRAVEEGKVVDMTMATRCFAADSVMNFIYQKPLGVLDAPDFQAPFVKAMDEFSATQQWSIYFPQTFLTLIKVMEKLPSTFAQKYMQPLALKQWVRNVCFERIQSLKARQGSKQDSVPTSSTSPSTPPRLEASHKPQSPNSQQMRFS